MNTLPLTRLLTRTLLVALALVLPFALTACGGAEETDGATQATPPAAEQMNDGMMNDGMAGGAAEPRMEDGTQVVEVTIVPGGYQPQEIRLQAGTPARLVFIRTTDQTCVTEIKVPAFDVGPVELPLGEPVAVEFTPDEAGTFVFTCGMDMVSGTIVVEA